LFTWNSWSMSTTTSWVAKSAKLSLCMAISEASINQGEPRNSNTFSLGKNTNSPRNLRSLARCLRRKNDPAFSSTHSTQKTPSGRIYSNSLSIITLGRISAQIRCSVVPTCSISICIFNTKWKGNAVANYCGGRPN
jgi:hypothetical protein